jgi:hypothetical protein
MSSAAQAAGTVTSDAQHNRDNTGGHFIVDLTVLNLLNQVTEISPDNATATGGTYTITVDGVASAGIAFGANAAAIKAALVLATPALSITLTGTLNAGPIVIEFLDGALHTVTASGTSLTGPDQPYTLTPTDTQDAGDPSDTTLTVTVQGQDPASLTWYSVLAGTAIASTGRTVLKVHPGITGSAGASAADILPVVWRLSCLVAGTSTSPSATFSVGANLVA